MAFIFASLSNIGAIYDGWWFAPVLEVLRCFGWLLYITSVKALENEYLNGFVVAYLTCSTIIWTSQAYKKLVGGDKITKVD